MELGKTVIANDIWLNRKEGALYDVRSAIGENVDRLEGGIRNIELARYNVLLVPNLRIKLSINLERKLKTF